MLNKKEIIEPIITVAGIIILFQFGIFIGKNFNSFENFLIELLNKLKGE